MGKKRKNKQRKPSLSPQELKRKLAELNLSSRSAWLDKHKNKISETIYHIMLDYTKGIYGDGWRTADDILSAYKKTVNPENITRSELIKILEFDSRFVHGYQGGSVFRLKNSNKVKSIFDSTGLIAKAPFSTVNIQDNNLAFKEEYRRLLGTPRFNNDILYVALGLDFGTSYTKAAFIESVNNKGLIPFGDQPMKASVVYSDNDFTRLSMFGGTETKKQIRYFKATISPLDDYQILKDADTKNVYDSSFLCSVFFVANIIKFISLKLSAYLQASTELQINMGMPTLYDNKVAHVYRKVLHAARYISGMDCDIRTVSIDVLREWVSEAGQTFNEDEYVPGQGLDSTYPELFAEALYLLEKRSYGSGFYTIIDIGGGTADFMFIEKHNINDKQSTYTCYWASVEPLGNEIRKAMEDKKKYNSAFVSKYCEMLVKSKNDIAGFGVKLNDVQTILFGGGKLAEEHFYEKLIKANGLDPKQYGFKTSIIDFSCDDITFIQPDKLAEDQRSTSSFRFVTAYRLATKVGDDNSRLQMLHVQPSISKTGSAKDRIIEEHKIKAGYEDIN